MWLKDRGFVLRSGLQDSIKWLLIILGRILVQFRIYIVGLVQIAISNNFYVSNFLGRASSLVKAPLVQWLKLPAWKVGDRGFVPRSDIQVSRKQNVSSPLTRKDSVLNFEFYVWLPKNPFILSVYSLHLPLSLNHTKWQSGVFSYKLRYIVGFGLVEMDISTNPKPTIYRNLYENTGPGFGIRFCYRTRLTHSTFPPHRNPQWRLVLYNFMTIEKLGSAAHMEKIYRLCDLSRLSPGRARHAGLRLFCKDKRQ